MWAGLFLYLFFGKSKSCSRGVPAAAFLEFYKLELVFEFSVCLRVFLHFLCLIFEVFL